MKMPKRSKNHTEALKKVDRTVQYDPLNALELTVSSSYVKFDETVDVAVRLSVDPRHADDNQSGYGTGAGNAAADGKARGAGKGNADAEGNFSMSINASGKL
jgi:large subunit ribosomal protein L1